MEQYTYLAHYGTKGMKWGERKYQNSDGSLTALGRVHYGVGEARKSVGKAAVSVKEAIRKRVAPTNAELNIKIRKQKSKNLNKEKRRQLKELKKGHDIDSTNPLDKDGPKGQHKKFSELSDKEIQDRINRLQNEIKLADLERTKNFGPGRRMVDDILKGAVKDAATKLLSKAITDAGTKAIDSWLETDSEKLNKEASDSKNRVVIKKELSDKAKALKDSGKYTDAQIARRLGVGRKDLPELLYDDKKKDDGKKDNSDNSNDSQNNDQQNSGKKNKNKNQNDNGTQQSSGDNNQQKPAAKEDNPYSEARVKERKEMERRAQAYRGSSDNPKMSYKEIADRMGLTVDQVKDLLFD